MGQQLVYRGHHYDYEATICFARDKIAGECGPAPVRTPADYTWDDGWYPPGRVTETQVFIPQILPVKHVQGEKLSALFYLDNVGFIPWIFSLQNALTYCPRVADGGWLVPPAGNTNTVATLSSVSVVSGAPQTLSTGLQLLLLLNIVSLHNFSVPQNINCQF